MDLVSLHNGKGSISMHTSKGQASLRFSLMVLQYTLLVAVNGEMF